MASKAKQSISKKQKSFAAAVKGVKTPSVFAKTSCKLTMPPGYPHRRLPKPTMENSFFIDLRTTDASDMEVAEALDKKCKNIRGIHYRDDLRIVEVIFATKDERDSNLDAIVIPNRKPVYPTCRVDGGKMVYIKMANVPYGDEEELREAIAKYWAEFGLVIDTAPHKVHGKWATRRWDIMLSIPENEKIEAPVAFELLGASIVAEWPKSPPSCLICKKAGHQAKKCPSKIPKAGGRPNPEKKDQQVTPAKIGQEKTESEKTSKTGLDEVPLPKPKKTDQIGVQSASVSVTASTSATVSETASVSASASISKSVIESADSEVEGSEMLTDEESEDERIDYSPFFRTGTKPERFSNDAWKIILSGITSQDWERLAAAPVNTKFDYAMQEIVDSKSKAEVNRMDTVTPPPFQFEDPTTPRKGNKRMVKDDNVVTAGNVEFVANVGGEGVRRSSRKRKPTKRK
jgi:hypothetical protein